MLLEWLRRKKNDDKTICELFYVCCNDIQDMELITALKQLLTILANGLHNSATTISHEVKSQLSIGMYPDHCLFGLYALILDGKFELLTIFCIFQNWRNRTKE